MKLNLLYHHRYQHSKITLKTVVRHLKKRLNYTQFYQPLLLFHSLLIEELVQGDDELTSTLSYKNTNVRPRYGYCSDLQRATSLV